MGNHFYCPNVNSLIKKCNSIYECKRNFWQFEWNYSLIEKYLYANNTLFSLHEISKGCQFFLQNFNAGLLISVVICKELQNYQTRFITRIFKQTKIQLFWTPQRTDFIESISTPNHEGRGQPIES